MIQPLEEEKQPFKREHTGSEDPVPSDPGALIVFLVGTGNTDEEQREWMEFVGDALRSAGSHPPSATEIRKQWEALKQKKGAQSEAPTVLDLPSEESR